MTRPITPLIAADILIELVDQAGRPLVLIQRRHPPLGWAIPGGFVDLGETMEQAAIREAREETSLEVGLIALLGLYSNPARDPRGHTVSAVYVAEARGEPLARDDALALGLFQLDCLPASLVFDHGMVLEDYRRYKQDGRVAPIRI